MNDGILLADVIEAVTSEKVRDIKAKPRNSAQMVDNINACLVFLSGLGVSVEGLSAKDIKDGNLKSILGLFFSLSRYKQQQKSQQHSGGGNNTGGSSSRNSSNVNEQGQMISKLPSPYSKQSNKCPTVTNPSTKDSTTAGKSKTQGTKSSLNQQNNNITQGSRNNNASSGRETSSSRSTSPSSTSGIPTPGGRALNVGRSHSLSDRHGHRIVNSTSTSSASSAASGTSKSTVTSGYQTAGSSVSNYSSKSVPANKNSMLDKFKFFNSKDKAAAKGSSGSSPKGSSSKQTASKPVENDCSESRASTGSVNRNASANETSMVHQASAGSPKQSSKSLKKTLRGALTSSKREGSPKPSKAADKDGMSKRSTPPPTAGRIVQPTPAAISQTAAKSGHNKSSPTLSRRGSGTSSIKTEKNEIKSGQNSPNLSKKTSKIAVAKTAAVASTQSSVAASTGLNSPNTSVPMPVGMTKANPIQTNSIQGTTSKSVSKIKDEKLRSSGSHRDLKSASSQYSSKTGPSTKSSGTDSRRNSGEMRASSKQTSDSRLNNSISSSSQNETYTTGLNSRNYKAGLGGDIGKSGTSGSKYSSNSHDRRAGSINNDQYSRISNSPNNEQQYSSTSQQRYANTNGADQYNSVRSNGGGSGHYGSLRSGDKVQSPSGSQYGSLKNSNERVQSPGGSSLHYGSLKNSNERVQSPGGSSHYGSLKSSDRLNSPSGNSHYGSLKNGDRTKSPSPSGNSAHYGSLKNGERIQSPSSSNYGSLKSEKSEKRSTSSNQKKQSPTKPERTSSIPNNSNNAAKSTRSSSTSKSSSSSTQKAPSKSKESSSSSSSISSSNKDSRNNQSSTSSSTDSTSQPSSSEKSVSSTESVIYKPTSCDEADPKSDTNASKTDSTTTDTEVGGAANKYRKNTASKNKEKMETTFDAEGRTETVTVQDEGSPEVMDIKPMQPILRSSPYTGYLRSIASNKQYPGPLSGGYGSTSRLGYHRPMMPDSSKYFSLKRTGPNNCTSSMIESTDYGSDAESFDISGYMSDGDILKSNHMTSDDFSGYMSEGGATLYARRMQQRFREGMQAVQECMQKSAGLTDDDSFDDSSSISSGDISDTIGDISTDENLTSTSQSACSDYHNPYGSLKRKDTNLSTKASYYGAKTAFIGNKNLNVPGSDYDYMAWRKYSAPEVGHNYVSLDYTSEPDTSTLHRWYKNDLKAGNYATTGSLRRNSNIEHSYTSSENLSRHHHAHQQQYDPHGHKPVKVDSETNTDQSMIMMRKQNPRAGGIPPSTAMNFGFRRPISGASTGSMGSTKSGGGTNRGTMSGKPSDPNKSTSPYAKPLVNAGNAVDQGRGMISPSKTGLNTHSSPDDAYKSNTLGRRRPDNSIKDRLFGSRSNLNKAPAQSSGETMCMSTIISNPHATLNKKNGSQPMRQSPSGRSDYATVNMPYVNSYSSAEYVAHHGRPLSGITSSNCSPQRLKHGQMSLSETESMESISSAGLNVQAQIQQARAHGLASRNILAQNRESFTYGVDRSNSTRSSKSDRMYQSLSQSFDETVARANSFSQIPGSDQQHTQPPVSPTGSVSSQSSSRFTYPMTAIGPNGSTHNLVRSSSQQSNLPYGMLCKSGSRDEDGLHSSQLSLASNSSSVYSTSEDKQANEVRKLRRELECAQEKVLTLTTQLSTNAHVVAAFEQSLSNMTSRLQTLTHTAEQKDSELSDLRSTIDALRATTGGMSRLDALMRTPTNSRKASTLSSPSALSSLDQPTLTRHLSSESMSSLNSMSSTCSMTSQQSSATDVMDASKKAKAAKKGSWLRSSLGKAFSKKKKNKNGSMSDADIDSASIASDMSMPNSPLLHGGHSTAPGTPIPHLKSSHSSSGLSENPEDVRKLQRALEEKDAKLTDIRLEALSSAHQLEHMKEAMMKMKNEMSALKSDNQRLQHMVSQSTPCSPESTLGRPTNTNSLERRLGLAERLSNIDMLLNDNDGDGRRINISVYTGNHADFTKIQGEKVEEILVGGLCINGKIKWDMLDGIVRRIFKDYCLRVDPTSCLGLNSESVFGYHIGEIVRTKDVKEVPELLPCGYLVGENMHIKIVLKGTYQMSVDSLAFETLIPKSIIQRYISLLIEHRRIILCGPSGTGKSYLAQKLGEYLVHRSGKSLSNGAIATFNVDHKSSKELRQYLTNIADQCENSSASEMPSVIILDNLHHVGSLGEVFNGFLSCKYQKCPYIIGTMNQATCATTNLQLHHNFRWVLCANHMEPVKGFLGRFLRRKLIETEIRTAVRRVDLTKVADWIPKVWQHLNKFLETHSSSDVTIGPRLFLSCPMDISGSQVWFTDLWNYSIVPYLLEAVREGIQMYGKRAPWEDPAEWVLEAYPWTMMENQESQDWPSLLRLRPEDVGYDTQGMISGQGSKSAPPQQAEGDGDPLLNMLMRLQEAASYSSPQSNDSDNISVDSHSGAQDANATAASPASTSPAPSTNATAHATANSGSIESTI
ncbi:uncharacterized protein LOC141913823 isoform X2 [Tubulanus polymorphus]|uniref:uncharacterized protein LOC141913823 isoform X2 n=1 Tax=Tubulanus polymorphus TaxID=672921 RepID=UPI003DA52CF3